MQQADGGAEGLGQNWVPAGPQAIGCDGGVVVWIQRVPAPELIEPALLLQEGQQLVLPTERRGRTILLVATAHRRLADQPCPTQQGQMGSAQMRAMGKQALGTEERAQRMGAGFQPGRGGVAEDHLAAERPAEVVGLPLRDRLHHGWLHRRRHRQIRQAADLQVQVAIQIALVEIGRGDPVLQRIVHCQ